MRDRLQRELVRREHIPHHIRATQVRIQAVTLVVRQMQMLTGKRTRQLRPGQMLAQTRIPSRVSHDLLYRLARLQQLPLPLSQLAVIGNAGAAGKQRDDRQR